MAGLWDTLMGLGQGFANGAQSFGDQAKWQMGAYGNAPMPAPYEGGPDYPAKNDANAYVRNNYPSEGMSPNQQPPFERFYTPYGAAPPLGGREPSRDEVIAGAPSMAKITPWLAEFLANHEKINNPKW